MSHVRFQMVMMLCILSFASVHANAQLNETLKLTASDAASGDQFGFSTRISGNSAIVGANLNDDDGNNSGSAYIFDRNQGGVDNWGEVVKLTASDAAAGDDFGSFVDIDSNTAIVGARFNDDTGNNSGSAYIFGRNQGGIDNWGEVVKLTASDAGADDAFGDYVTLLGDIAVVGADLNNDAGSNSGSAYIFGRNQGGIDNWGEITKLTASDAAADDRFGRHIAISGDTIVVSAFVNGDAGYGTGSAYIFDRNQGGVDNWGEVAKLTASDAAANDFFGEDVAISGDTVVVGAAGNSDDGSNSGSAYIFRRNQGGADNWGEVFKLTASDATADSFFGDTVAISGTTAVIGAFRDDAAGSNTGSGYVFDTTTGNELFKLTASDAAADDELGLSLAFSGTTAIIGARFDDDAGSASGSTYIFEIAPPIEGDLNFDGFVGIDDLNIILSHWNEDAGVGNPQPGDITGDGFVGIDDLNRVLGNWNAGTPPSSSSVPEPGTVVLLVLGMVAMLRRVA
jgi:FG-GAP repeat